MTGPDDWDWDIDDYLWDDYDEDEGWDDDDDYYGDTWE